MSRNDFLKSRIYSLSRICHGYEHIFREHPTPLSESKRSGEPSGRSYIERLDWEWNYVWNCWFYFIHLHTNEKTWTWKNIWKYIGLLNLSSFWSFDRGYFCDGKYISIGTRVVIDFIIRLRLSWELCRDIVCIFYEIFAYFTEYLGAILKDHLGRQPTVDLGNSDSEGIFQNYTNVRSYTV